MYRSCVILLILGGKQLYIFYLEGYGDFVKASFCRGLALRHPNIFGFLDLSCLRKLQEDNCDRRRNLECFHFIVVTALSNGRKG